MASFRDNCPFALGTATWVGTGDRKDDHLMVDFLIHKDQKLPCDESARYMTRDDHQVCVDFEIYENESRKRWTCRIRN